MVSYGYIKCVGSMEQFAYLLFYQRNNRRSQRKKGTKKKPVSCALNVVATSCFLQGFFLSFFYDKHAPSESPLMTVSPIIWNEILQLLTVHYCHPGENTRCTPPPSPLLITQRATCVCSVPLSVPTPFPLAMSRPLSLPAPRVLPPLACGAPHLGSNRPSRPPCRLSVSPSIAN